MENEIIPIVPFSRGGTSLKADNMQLPCARHNIAKRDRIEWWIRWASHGGYQWTLRTVCGEPSLV